MTEPTPTSAITGYHAHIYYHDDEERARAAKIREILEKDPDNRMGRWRDEPVGPHPVPMYQVAFPAEKFAEIVPWLMLNRDGLTVLVHPETGNDVEDHRDKPLWLGQKLELNIAFLEAGNTSA